jgi:hypothetical protein
LFRWNDQPFPRPAAMTDTATTTMPISMLAASSNNISNANVVLTGGMMGFHTASSLMEQNMLMHSLQSSSPAARRAMNTAGMFPPPHLLPNQRLQQPWSMNNVNVAVELLRRQQRQQQQGL